MDSIAAVLNSDFVKQAGAAGVAVLILGGLLYLFLTKTLPRLNSTWAAEIAEQRKADKERADADRQLYREIHDEGVRTATARHEEARGWHGEIVSKLDRIDEKIPDRKSSPS